MILDTSVLIAILSKEPEERIFVDAIVSAASISISAGSWIELSAVIQHRFKSMPAEQPDDLRRSMRITIEPVTAQQAMIGHDAYIRFGRASDSRAKLNFGDCFSYALAIARDEPLLFKGDDFIHTDVVPALPQRG